MGERPGGSVGTRWKARQKADGKDGLPVGLVLSEGACARTALATLVFSGTAYF